MPPRTRRAAHQPLTTSSSSSDDDDSGTLVTARRPQQTHTDALAAYGALDDDETSSSSSSSGSFVSSTLLATRQPSSEPAAMPMSQVLGTKRSLDEAQRAAAVPSPQPSSVVVSPPAAVHHEPPLLPSAAGPKGVDPIRIANQDQLDEFLNGKAAAVVEQARPPYAPKIDAERIDEMMTWQRRMVADEWRLYEQSWYRLAVLVAGRAALPLNQLVRTRVPTASAPQPAIGRRPEPMPTNPPPVSPPAATTPPAPPPPANDVSSTRPPVSIRSPLFGVVDQPISSRQDSTSPSTPPSPSTPALSPSPSTPALSPPVFRRTGDAYTANGDAYTVNIGGRSSPLDYGERRVPSDGFLVSYHATGLVFLTPLYTAAIDAALTHLRIRYPTWPPALLDSDEALLLRSPTLVPFFTALVAVELLRARYSSMRAPVPVSLDRVYARQLAEALRPFAYVRVHNGHLVYDAAARQRALAARRAAVPEAYW